MVGCNVAKYIQKTKLQCCVVIHDSVWCCHFIVTLIGYLRGKNPCFSSIFHENTIYRWVGNIIFNNNMSSCFTFLTSGSMFITIQSNQTLTDSADAKLYIISHTNILLYTHITNRSYCGRQVRSGFCLMSLNLTSFVQNGRR